MTLRYEYEPGYCGELIADNGETVCTFTDEPNKANARRLVTCWNACEGIRTEDLERGHIVMTASDLSQERENQRDELLETLKAALKLLQELNDMGEESPITETLWMPSGHETLFDFMGAAITKAEGKA